MANKRKSTAKGRKSNSGSKPDKSTARDVGGVEIDYEATLNRLVTGLGELVAEHIRKDIPYVPLSSLSGVLTKALSPDNTNSTDETIKS